MRSGFDPIIYSDDSIIRAMWSQARLVLAGASYAKRYEILIDVFAPFA